MAASNRDSPPALSWLPGFSEADLEENEAGRLSAAQREILASAVDGELVMAALTGLLFTAAALALSNFVVSVIVACVFGAIIYDLVTHRRSEAARTTVERAEGDVIIRVVYASEDSDDYVVEINELTLWTTESVYRAFRAGGPYRLFYLQDSRRVVAMKALEGWRPLGKLGAE